LGHWVGWDSRRVGGTVTCTARWAAVFLAALAVCPHWCASQEQPAPAPVSTDPVELSARAHAIVSAGAKVSGLDGDDVKPFHLKVDFTFQDPNLPKLLTGTMEEWSEGRYQWKRIYKSSTEAFNGTEWSLSRLERYRPKPNGDPFDYHQLDGKVAGTVIAPLSQSGNIQPEYEMTLKRVNLGVMLNCVYVADPKRYAGDGDADAMFPKSCLDDANRLRLLSFGDTVVQFNQQQTFENRWVARDVKMTVKGLLMAEMKVTLLEPLAPADAEQVKPGKGAVPQPYERQAGDPPLVPVFQTGASIPLTPDHRPNIGTETIPIVIQKDGSVKLVPHPPDPVYDAVSRAVARWKYQPYSVDGQVVEVATDVQYVMNLKPFVPEYERKK
jgi:hypothetical protein